jgi:hypothetical protein
MTLVRKSEIAVCGSFDPKFFGVHFYPARHFLHPFSGGGSHTFYWAFLIFVPL